MHARISVLSFASGSEEQAIGSFRDAVSQVREMTGNRGAVLLIDRDGGRGTSVTLWESEQAMVDSRNQATQVRQQAAAGAAGEIISVEEYEVAVWEVDSG